MKYKLNDDSEEDWCDDKDHGHWDDDDTDNDCVTLIAIKDDYEYGMMMINDVIVAKVFFETRFGL